MNGIVRPALYARVSSQKQADEKTIESQCEEIRKRIVRDELRLSPDYVFCDDGYSGAELLRPALERLRDRVAAGLIDRIYIHSPDRLSRKMAHQALLLEEFCKYHCQVVFLNQEGMPDSPEANLLIQMQGVIAEYEREKILERTRRGRRHSATQGNLSVFGGVPYGYRYVTKSAGGGQARWEIDHTESELVRWMFEAVDKRGYSLGKICRELATRGVRTATGKALWAAATIRGILRNTAYYGEARFFQSRLVPRKPGKRAKRGDPAVPQQSRVAVDTDPSEQVVIPVPSIIDAALFRRVSERMEENRKRQRERHVGAKYLLSGLVLCGSCGSAYCTRQHGGGKYFYYRCIGGDKTRRANRELCGNPAVNGPELERVTWLDLCKLLTDRNYLHDELNRRREEQQTPDEEILRREREVKQLRVQLDRLIDAYTGGFVDREEFESRIGRMRDRHTREESALMSLRGSMHDASDMNLAKDGLARLALEVESQLSTADAVLKRQLLKLLINRIEIHPKEIRIVYKVPRPPFASSPDGQGIFQHWLSGSE